MNSASLSRLIPHSYLGIFLYCSAIFLFVVMDSIVKYANQTYEPLQMVWARYFFHMILLVLFLAPKFKMNLVKTNKLGLQVFRSMLLLGATVCFFTALKYIPLADAGAMGSTSPLFVTVLSVFILKETVSFRRWTAVLIGFAGALIILRPGMGIVHPAMFLVLGMSVCYASYQVATRILAGQDSSIVTIFYTSLVGTVVMSAVVPFFWVQPDLFGWGVLVVVGLIGGVSHYLIILAFNYTTASTAAPFSYTQLIWTAIFGYFAFGDLPDELTILGALIIVSSGLYILYRERIVNSAKQQ